MYQQRLLEIKIYKRTRPPFMYSLSMKIILIHIFELSK